MSIILFKDGHFGGNWQKLKTATPHLKDVGLQDAVSSLIVTEGVWNLYKDGNYEGKTWTVRSDGGPKGDGLYPHASDWQGENDAISSLKPVS